MILSWAEVSESRELAQEVVRPKCYFCTSADAKNLTAYGFRHNFAYVMYGASGILTVGGGVWEYSIVMYA